MVKEQEKILEIVDLDISFSNRVAPLHAVRGVSIDVRKGKTTAIVGESGSGKTVTMKAVAGILPASAWVNRGKIIFYDRNQDGDLRMTELLSKDKSWMRKNINGKRIAMVFQDPMSSLNPVMSIGKQVMEGMLWHKKVSQKEAWAQAETLLEEVGIEDAPLWMKRYPHQLSGGMCQRVVIAAAIACQPDLLICDEPTTALDAAMQIKIIDLIRQLQEKHSMSVLYITHDLGAAARAADDVYVMYGGKIVEKGRVEEVFYDPRHPYTWGLLLAMPDPKKTHQWLDAIPGTPPNLLQEGSGDVFAPRNNYALVVDDKAQSPMFAITKTHAAATWLLDARAPKAEMPDELKRRIERMKREAQRDGKL